MFTKLSETTISSDEGYVVKIGTDYRIEYQVGARSTTMDKERLAEPWRWLLYPKSIKRWEPDGTPIDETERGQIVENIIKVMEFTGKKWEMYGPDGPNNLPPELTKFISYE